MLKALEGAAGKTIKECVVAEAVMTSFVDLGGSSEPARGV